MRMLVIASIVVAAALAPSLGEAASVEKQGYRLEMKALRHQFRDPERCIALANEALALYDAHGLDEPLRRFQALYFRGLCHWQLNDLRRAEADLADAYPGAVAYWGGDHTLGIREHLTNWSELAYNRGQNDKALALVEQALGAADDANIKPDYAYVRALWQAGEIRQTLGLHEDALADFQAATELADEVGVSKGLQAVIGAGTIQVLAIVGDFDRAEAMYVDAISQTNRELVGDFYTVGAFVAVMRNDMDTATRRVEQAFASRINADQRFTLLDYMYAAHFARDEYAEALALAERQLELSSSPGAALDDESLALANALRAAVELGPEALAADYEQRLRTSLAFAPQTYLTGWAHGVLGDVSSERQDWKQAVDDYQNALANEDLFRADRRDVLGGLSHALFQLDRRVEAQEASMAGLELGDAARRSLWKSASERELLLYRARLHRYVQDHVTIWDGIDRAPRAWQAVLEWKGETSRLLVQRNAEGRSFASGRAKQRLARVRTQIAEQGVEGTALTEQKDMLERRLALLTEVDAVTPRQICDAMGTSEVLVDFFRTRDAYAVFIVDRFCRPTRVDLPDADHIDMLARRWHTLLATPAASSEKVDAAGRELSEALWFPLLNTVMGRERVFLSPDAALATIPFGALPHNDGGYVLEKHELRYLDSAAWLALDRPPLVPDSALLVGAIDYAEEVRTQPCQRGPLQPLPGTAAELDAIAGRLEGWRAVQTLTGDDATRKRTTHASHRASIVHLATHGLLMNPACTEAPSDPMLRSSIVLADATLTAEEVAGLDLSETWLATLSACSTGLGQTTSGDGVLGLRRGFAQAGARNLVMSLWNIDDEATAQLMSDFYAGIAAGAHPAAALREAQLRMLRLQRMWTGESRPFTWGAFVAAGR